MNPETNLPVSLVLQTFAKDAKIDIAEATRLFRDHLRSEMKDTQYFLVAPSNPLLVHKFFCRCMYFFLVGSWYRHNIYNNGTHRKWQSAKTWAMHVVHDSLSQIHEDTKNVIFSMIPKEVIDT